MKRFVVGLLLGLSLSAVPVLAEWDMLDYQLLKRIASGLDRQASARAHCQGFDE